MPERKIYDNITFFSVYQRLASMYRCADPGIFIRGGGGEGPGQSDKKALTTIFLVLSLFYRSQMVNFKEIYRFSRLQMGSNFFQGVQLFLGVSNCLFPIETHLICDFQEGVRTPCPPPLWIRTWCSPHQLHG